ncbi:hypothetical protein BRD17_00680 [Halobacteriales archaeon SW_7_68_16]|nr:MAG: hypothetical protein BRD17_00680 [Halobacteriales archaeon SW_7_68_16]
MPASTPVRPRGIVALANPTPGDGLEQAHVDLVGRDVGTAATETARDPAGDRPTDGAEHPTARLFPGRHR